MANQLTDLTVREVSLVDRPANAEKDPKTGAHVPRATIALFKRDGDIEKYSMNQGRDKGKYRAGGGVGPGQHAAEHADNKDAHLAAAAHHLQAATQANSTDGLSAHILASKAHDNAASNPSRTASLTARNLSQAAGRFGIITKEDAEIDEVTKAIEGKTVDGKIFPKSDFAYTPSDNVSEWKLRLTSTPGGDPDPRIVGAAVAALGPGGYRGQTVEIPDAARAAVKAKVRSAWKKANPDKGSDDLPEILKSEETEMPADQMTIDDIVKKQTAQDAEIAKANAEIAKQAASITALTEENQFFKSRAEVAKKMSAKEKSFFDEMSDDDQKKYMAADDAGKKEMMDACDKKAKAKAAKANKNDDGEDGSDVNKGDAVNITKAEYESLVLKVNTVVSENATLKTALTKSQTDLADIHKRERLLHFTSIAKSHIDKLSGTDVEKGATLQAMADACGGEDTPLFKQYLETQKTANKLMKSNLRPIGKDGGGTGGGEGVGVMGQLEAKAGEIAKRDGVGKEIAFAKALKENPDLYEEYEAGMKD